MTEFLVGIDSSERSPGVFLYHAACNCYMGYGWTHSQKEADKWQHQKLPLVCDCFDKDNKTEKSPKLKVSVRLIRDKSTFANDDERLDYVSDLMVESAKATIELCCPDEKKRVVRVYVEEPPLHMIPGVKTSSMSGLRDVLASTRNKFFRLGYAITGLNNMVIKKTFAGHGRAKKPDMHRAFKKWWEVYDYAKSSNLKEHERQMFGFPMCILNIKTNQVEWSHMKRNANSNPLQDLVDAFAVIQTVLYPIVATTKKRKKTPAATAEKKTKKKRKGKTNEPVALVTSETVPLGTSENA